MIDISREDFKKMIAQGRKIVWAGLYERQDYMVKISSNEKRPIRDITNEPSQHGRKIITIVK